MNEYFFMSILDTLGVPYTDSFVKSECKFQPFGASLYGLSIMLTKFGIGCDCIQMNFPDELSEVSLPCIILYDNRFAIVKKINPESVTLYSTDGQTLKVDRTEFNTNWNCIALLMQKNAHSSEPDFASHRKSQQIDRLKRLGLLGFLAIILFCGILINPLLNSWSWWSLIVINGLGVYVAFMLLQKQLHISNPVADKLCGLAKESHCEDVTESDGGSFFGLFKLSEIGAAFFGVNLIFLIFAPKATFLLAIVAVTVLPFSFWSIWYQKFKAKSWCVLCLCSLTLMWAQAIIYMAGGYFNQFNHQWTVSLSALASYGLVTLLINFLMASLKEIIDNDHWHFDYNVLKTQDKVIEAYEGSANRFPTDADECSSILFGDPQAPFRITVFSNPYCAPCAKLHHKIKDLPGESVCINYVMTYFSEEASIINRKLIAAYQQLGPEATWKLMTQWYDNGKTHGVDFFNSMNLDDSLQSVTDEFEKHRRWRADKRLRGTPTVIVNGRELTGPYSVEDYIYMPAS